MSDAFLNMNLEPTPNRETMSNNEVDISKITEELKNYDFYDQQQFFILDVDRVIATITGMPSCCAMAILHNFQFDSKKTFDRLTEQLVSLLRDNYYEGMGITTFLANTAINGQRLYPDQYFKDSEHWTEVNHFTSNSTQNTITNYILTS